MNPNELLDALARFEKRLATIADQAREVRDQAQHTLDRLNRLRRDFEQLRSRYVSTSETGEFGALKPPDRDR